MRGLKREQRWVGTSVPRQDLQPLVEGRGRYTDDFQPPGMLQLAVVRSQRAHARITRLDLGAAAQMPGVVATFGPADAGGLPGIPILSVVPEQRMSTHPLFFDKALYVGQPLAMIVAESRYLAEDAAEAVVVEYEALPAVTSVEAALAPDSPRLHPDWPDNVAAAAVLQAGDPAAAMAAADFVLEETFRTPRQMAIPLETRSILADYDAKSGSLTVHYSTQAPGPFRTYLAELTGIAEDRIRVIVPNVGGGFGNKLHYFPDEVAACLLSVRLGRPVKYVEDRWEHFVAMVHSREQTIKVKVGVGSDGTLLAIEGTIVADAGAHLHSKGNAPAWLTMRMLPGPYRLAHYHVVCRAVVTNKTPYGAYRGFGQPQAAYVHEQIMDRIAQRLGLDPVEVRRRNLIRSDEMPYRNCGQLLYDSGDFPASLEAAVELADYPALRLRQAEARAAGRLYGIGIAALVEYTAMGPSRLMRLAGNRQGGYESALVRITPSGSVACYTGLIELGQGTTTALAQICADHLGVRPEAVNVYSGDTHIVPYSFYGTAASRGAALAGGATVLACRQLRDKVFSIAAHLLQAPLDDVELADGAVRRLGKPETAMQLKELARAAWRGQDLPVGMEPGLEAKAIYDPENWTYSNQAHVVGCEVDTVTGQVRIDAYALSHDCGTVLNPQLVEGQTVGAIAQGLGGALLEEVVYSPEGQLLSGTFMDYLLPTAMEMPDVAMVHMETPAPHIPGGMKGVGEGGTIGANVAVIGAVLDALGERGRGCNTFPLTPDRILALLRRSAGDM